jgi:hypothetical protein
MNDVDFTSLVSKFKPWTQTSRGGKSFLDVGTVSNLPVQDLLSKKYLVITKPRPAHIASGVASGIFNGVAIEGEGNYPPLLIKGVFHKEYKTVEEKRNKDGEVRAVVQIQQPVLATTVLDLTTFKYHTLKTGTNYTESLNLSDMTISDILRNYGSSMSKVMDQQCPVFYDSKKDSIDLVLPARPLYEAQADAAKALVKMYRSGLKASYLLGEIGVGKSSVGLVTAKTVGAKRPLVFCPPHLLDSWRNEITSVYPGTVVKVLSNISDVEDVASLDTKEMVVSVVSRETAKLSHGWEGVGKYCPKCNSATPDVDLVKNRSRCKAVIRYPKDTMANLCAEIAHSVFKYLPDDYVLNQLAFTRLDKIRLENYKKIPVKPKFQGIERSKLEFILETALTKALKLDNLTDNLRNLIAICLFLLNDSEITERTFLELCKSKHETDNFTIGLLSLLPKGPLQDRLFSEKIKNNPSYWNPWENFRNKIAEQEFSVRLGTLDYYDGLTLDNRDRSSVELVSVLLENLIRLGKFGVEPECGEFLYQASPTPRRMALANYIAARHKKLFDFLIIDESHEINTDGSAQEVAAHKLQQLGMPTLLQTGSLMNGYAASLFVNMWYSSSAFRDEFSRDDRQLFVDRYGYRKRILEDKDKDTGKIIEFGSHSDRVVRTERSGGNAPGVLPLFIFRYLLNVSVTLHKSDLAINLPPNVQEKVSIEPSPVQKERFEALTRILVDTIKKDRFNEDLAGKLFGQLVELPSYLDRATSDVGNTESGDYDLTYPESVGGSVVFSQAGLSNSEVLPKEEWLIAKISEELRNDRPVIILTWHTNLLRRYQSLIEGKLKIKAPILFADKVKADKRQDWINKEVLAKGRKVLLTNPVAIQTGLNNLVSFSTQIWMENPACNPIIYRQAIGRIDRIGQKKETRIFFPVYSGTLQDKMYDLLLKKVAISIATDGLDPESTMQASGLGDDSYLEGLSIGKQLWNIITADDN